MASGLANISTTMCGIYNGYLIEIGNTTYSNSLEERIQIAKQAQKNKEKLLALKRKTIVKKDTSLESMAINKSNNRIQVPKFKKINKQWSTYKTNFVPASNVSSTNYSMNRNRNSSLSVNYGSTSIKSTFKGGGLMQNRLEKIKANKTYSNVTSIEVTKRKTVVGNDTHLGNQTIKRPNDNDYGPEYKKMNTRQCLSFESTFVPASNVSSTNYSMNRNTNSSLPINYKSMYKIEDSVLYPLETINVNKRFSNVTSTKNYKNCSLESLKFSNNPSKTTSPQAIIKNYCHNKYDTNCYKLNEYNIRSIGKKHDSGKIDSSHNALVGYYTNNIPYTSNFLNKSAPSVQNRLMKVRREMLNKSKFSIQNDVSKTELTQKLLVSEQLGNWNALKKLSQNQLESFSYVIPETFSVQQKLENENATSCSNTQSTADNSMEWEYVEPINIINTVNDIRKTIQEHELMEWSSCSLVSDTVVYYDKIDYCLVIDTNVLLLDLKPITIAIDTCFPDYGYFTFMLPWQVLQELDYIKKQLNNLGFRAREAVRWILGTISNKHPRLKGQPIMNKSDGNNDDAILKCAYDIKEKTNQVYLITDDHILSVKSECSGVPVKNSKWLTDLVSDNTYKKYNNHQDNIL